MKPNSSKPGPVNGQLTRSLHTVTAVVRVATYLNDAGHVDGQTIEQLTASAFAVLGYNVEELADADPTLTAAVRAVRKALDGGAA